MHVSGTNRIARGIAALEAAHLDHAGRVSLAANTFPARIGMVRMSSLARFWQDDQHALTGMEERQVSLVRGLADAGLPWAYALVGEDARVEVYLGLTGGDVATGEWERPLKALFPGSTWEQGPTSLELMQRVAPDGLAVSLTGNPARMPVPDSAAGTVPHCQMESIVRGMLGSHWIYLTMATPIASETVESSVDLLMEERQEICSAFLRSGTSEADNHPVAQRYLELLDAAWQHYDDGRANGMWDVSTLLLAEDHATLTRAMRLATAAFGGTTSRPQPLRIQACALTRNGTAGALPSTRLSTTEAVTLTRFLTEDFPGYRVRDHVGFAAAGPSIARGEPSIQLGTVRSNGAVSSARANCNDFCKHVFVCGATGSGKTRTCQVILLQLWQEHGIPWMVIEPANKAEYRHMLDGPIGQDVHVFTLGNETAMPLRVNPLEVMSHVHVQRHIDGLVGLFTAAFSWVTPMPYVLTEALYRLYQNFGWDLTTGVNPRNHGPESQPTIADLLAVVPPLVDELGYGREITGNLRAGLETRLRSLTWGAKGAMLNTRLSTSMDWIMGRPTVLEFAKLGDDETKAFVMATLLLRLTEYYETQAAHSGGLRHVTLLEEAHRLLRATPEALDNEIAHAREKAVELFTNLLAEIRVAGEGLIVVDQAPSKLAQDVLRNTGLKIAHRVVEGSDRRALADAMNLTDEQTRKLGALEAGAAMLYQEGEEGPTLIQVPDMGDDRGQSTPFVSDDQICLRMATKVPARQSARPVSGSDERAGNSACFGCNGDCIHRRTALRALLDADPRQPFQRALEDGWDTLWQFGMEIARSTGECPNVADLAYCVLMQLFTACRLPSELRQKAARNLRVRKELSGE